MPIIVRTFRARPGRQSELTEGLHTLASATVRYGRGASVVICQQSNAPDQFMWIGDRGGSSDLTRVDLRDELIKTFEESLAECSAPLSLGFLDEFYRFPASPGQLWSLEAHAPADDVVGMLSDLFDLLQLARRERRVVGMSLYRAVEDAGTFVGFVALTEDFTNNLPAQNGLGQLRGTERIERSAVWRPLSVVCEVRRPTARKPLTGSGQEISSAPFWVRSGVVRSVSAISPEAEQLPPGVVKQKAQSAVTSRMPVAWEGRTPSRG